MGGARAVVRRRSSVSEDEEVVGPGIIADIDMPAELERLIGEVPQKWSEREGSRWKRPR